MEFVGFVVVIGAIITLLWKVLHKRMTVAKVETTEQQRNITGGWYACAGSHEFHLVLSLKGQFFEGTIADSTGSWPVEGSYVAPKIRFDLDFAGNQFMFEGTVTPDGNRIDGLFSDFVDKKYWFAKRPAKELSESQECAQLVYLALNNILSSTARVATLPASTRLYDIVQNTATEVDGSQVMTVPARDMEVVRTSSKQLNQPAVPPDYSTATLDFAPPVAAPFIAATALAVNEKKCPKCNSDLDGSFTFCLHCGHTS